MLQAGINIELVGNVCWSVFHPWCRGQVFYLFVKIVDIYAVEFYPSLLTLTLLLSSIRPTQPT